MTEWISNVNIPACQLLIGMGVPLHRIPDIRRLFGKDPTGVSPIDFEADAQLAPSGLLPLPLNRMSTLQIAPRFYIDKQKGG